jgi:hypothetical protein
LDGAHSFSDAVFSGLRKDMKLLFYLVPTVMTS